MRACGWWWAAMLLVTWTSAAPSSEEDKTGNRLDDPSSAAANGVGDAAVAAVGAAASAGLFGPQLRTLLGALENVDDMLRSTIPTIDRFQCIERLMCSVMTSSTSSSSPITSALQQAFDPTFQQGVIQDPQSISQEFLQNPALQGLLSQTQQGGSSATSALQGLLSQTQQGGSSATSALQGLLSQTQQGGSSASSALQGLLSPTQQGGSSATSILQGLLSQFSGLQQGISPQSPAFQGSLQQPSIQNPAFLPPPPQGFNPQFQQPPPGFDPQFQQPPPGFDPQFQQPPPGFDPQFQQPPPGFDPQFQQPPPGFDPQFQPHPGQVAPSGFQFQGTSFQNGFPNFRENPDTHRRTNVPRPQRRRRPSKRPQRNRFFDFLGRLGVGRRKKRSVFTDLLGGFTGERFMTLIDQMMTQYSFYPYTHAALMGYTGSSRRCESLYPSCPSTPEEMIDVFNNIHRHYPEGIPYKENLPWPLNILLP